MREEECVSFRGFLRDKKLPPHSLSVLSRDMKPLLLLLLLPLLQVGGSLRPPTRPQQLTRPTGEVDDPLRRLVRERLSSYKEEIEASLLGDYNHPLWTEEGSSSEGSSGPLRRTKRATITADTPQVLERRRRQKLATPVAEKGTYVVTKSYRVSPNYFDGLKVLDLNSIVYDNNSFLFALEDLPQGRKEVCVYKVNSGLSLEELWRQEVPGATSLEVVEISKKHFILPLVPSAPGDIDIGSILYRVDFQRRSFRKVQTINTAYARSCAFWKGSGEEANDVFLAVAPEFHVSGGQRSLRVEVRVFRWQGGYFDYVSSVPASNPQSISFFSVHSDNFLVVPNFGDDTGSTTVHSEIFRYQHKDSRFVSHQRIRTSGASDIKHFSFVNGNTHEHFLAVANNCDTDEYGNKNYNVKSFIMKFTLRRFILFKSFATYGAVEFLPVTLGEKFFLVLADMKGLKIFQYNGWSFVQTYEDPLPNLGHPITSIKLRSFLFQEQPFYTVSSNSSNFQSGIYSVQMTLKDDYTKMNLDLEKWCEAAKTQVFAVDFNDFTRRFLAAPKTTQQSITFRYPLTFAGNVDVHTVEAQTLHYDGTTFNSALRDTLLAQSRQSSDLSYKVDQTVEEMNNVAFVDGSHTFTGPVRMDSSVYISHPEISVAHLQLNDTLNGYHLKSLLPDVILRHRDYSHAKLHANHVKITGEIHTKQLNSVDVGHYALLNAPSLTFTARNTFFEELTVAKNLSVADGVFGGVDFSQPPKFLLAQGNQTFAAIHVEHSHATHLHTKFVNGQEVDYFYKDAVHLNEDVVLTGQKEWDNVNVNGDLSLEGLLNERDLTRIMSTAVTTHNESQRMTGTAHFGDIQAKYVELPGGAEVNSPPVNLQKDLVSTEASLPPHHFSSILVEEDAAVDSLVVTQNLNHILVLEHNRLDILLRDSSTPQVLRAKTFHQDISISENVIADQLVDGVDLKNWNASRRILLNKSTFSKKVVINGELVTPHRLTVRRNFKLGQRDILPLLRYVAPLSASRLPGSCAIHFQSLRVLGNTLVRKDLNGQKPLESWLRRDARQEYNVSGVTWIDGDVYLEEHIDSKGLYGLPESERNLLQVLPHLLIDGAEQTFPGDVRLLHGLRAEQISCPDTVFEGDVPFSALLRTDSLQTVLVETTFKGSVHVAESVDISGNIISVPLVNEVDLDDEIKDTFFKRSSVPQVIQGKWRIEDDVEATDVETDGYVNSINLHKFLGSLILSNHSGPLVLYAESVVLESGADVTSILLDSSSSIDNFLHGLHWGADNYWLMNTGDQTVFTPLQFSDGTLKVDAPLIAPHSSKVHLEGHEGVVDIAELDANVIRRHLGGTLNGITHFGDDVIISSKLDLAPSVLVNDRLLQSSAVLSNRTTPLVVDEPRVFNHGIDVFGNLQLSGKVDNVDINPAIQFLYPGDSSLVNESLVVHGNLVLKIEPHIRHTVNGINLHELLDNVWFTDSHAILQHPVAFQNVSFKGKSPVLTGRLDQPLLITDVDVRDILEMYVSKEKNQVWTGNVTFDTATIKRLITETITIDGALFNGIDVETFVTSILLNGTDQELFGDWEFSKLHANYISPYPDDVDVTVNGMNVIEDFMRLTAPHGNKVTGLKTITEELDVEEIVLTHDESISLGGIDVEEWHSGSVKTYGDHVLEGPVSLQHFYGNLKVSGLVDGVRVDKDHILLRRGPQKIPGRMIVDLPEGLPHTAALTAPYGIHVSGLFNEYNLTNTFGHLVRKSDKNTEPLVIYGEKTFASPIVVTQVTTSQLFHGRNLSQLFHDFYSGLAIPRDLHFRAHDKYSLLEEFTQQLSHSSSQAVFLEFFFLSQELTHSTGKPEVTFVDVLFGLRELTLAVGVQDSSVTTDTWWTFDFSSRSYRKAPLHSLRISGQVVSYKEVDAEEHFILIAVQSPKGSGRSAQLSADVRKAPSFVETNKAGGKRRSKTFVLKDDRRGNSSTFLLSQVISAESFGALQTFDDSSGQLSSCFLVAPSDSDALLLCPAASTFQTLQTIPLRNISHTTSMEGLGRTFLFLLQEDVAHVWTHTSSSSSSKFHSSSCLPLSSPVVSTDAIFGSNHIPFFAVASSGPSHGFVSIYKFSLDDDRFHKAQTVDVIDPLQLKFLRAKPSAEVFLFVLSGSPEENLFVYKYKGLSGWTLEHKWRTQQDARLLQIVDFTVDDSHYLTQVIVSSATSSRIYSASFKGLPETHPQTSMYY